MTNTKHFLVIAFILFSFKLSLKHCKEWDRHQEISDINHPKNLAIKLNYPEISSSESFVRKIFSLKSNQGSEINYSLTKYKLNHFKEYFLNTIESLSNSIMEDSLMSCETDEKYVYYIRLVVNLEKYCQPANKINMTKKKVVDDHDSYELFSELFNSLHTLSGEGKKGLVKKFTRTINHKKKKVIIKRVSRENLDVKELYFLHFFSLTDLVPEFYGCQYDSNYGYIMQEAMQYDLSSDQFLNLYDRFTLLERIDFIIELSQKLESFHTFGVIHADIKPLNIMIDSDNKIRLIDFDGVANINGIDSDCITHFYAHPSRYQTDIAHPFFDFYSLLMTIISIENINHTKAFEKVVETGEDQLKICFTDRKGDLCIENIRKIIQKYITKRWTFQETSLKNNNKGSFPEILERVVCDSALKINRKTFNPENETSLSEFIKRMQEIREDIKLMETGKTLKQNLI